jgi:hypothetical protein
MAGTPPNQFKLSLQRPVVPWPAQSLMAALLADSGTSASTRQEQWMQIQDLIKVSFQ